MSERQPLPRCDCPACQRAVAILARPVRVLTPAEAEARNAAWLHRTSPAPLVPRDELEARG